MTDNGRTTSIWMATTAMKEERPLASDARADVCIVGAGIAGLTTAYLLAKEGKRVIVVDDGPTAGGETCRTTAHLVSALDDRPSKISTSCSGFLACSARREPRTAWKANRAMRRIGVVHVASRDRVHGGNRRLSGEEEPRGDENDGDDA